MFPQWMKDKQKRVTRESYFIQTYLPSLLSCYSQWQTPGVTSWWSACTGILLQSWLGKKPPQKRSSAAKEIQVFTPNWGWVCITPAKCYQIGLNKTRWNHLRWKMVAGDLIAERDFSPNSHEMALEMAKLPKAKKWRKCWGIVGSGGEVAADLWKWLLTAEVGLIQ